MFHGPCLSLMLAFAAVDQPDFAPLPTSVEAPEDNPATPEKIALGKQLFFDPRLSGDNSQNCASCHLPEKAFADGQAFSLGHDDQPLARNTPTLLNSAHFDVLHWDGRAAGLEEQALLPIESPLEMNQNLDELERELNAVPEYAAQFTAAFGGGATRENVAKALAAFERTLVTGPSAVDKYMAGDRGALSDAAKRGMDLFFGDAGCVRCHQGPLLSDGKFYRLGIASRDAGRRAVTGAEEDGRKFRTPGLRNVAETAPYMHNGSFKTITEVVEFYYRGVPAASDAQGPEVSALTDRSYSEVADVVAFLEALSGETPRVEPPTIP